MNSISSSFSTSARLSAQLAARSSQQAGEVFAQQAGQTQGATAAKQKEKTQASEKTDLQASLKAIQSQIDARIEQANDVNTLDISYSKKAALLSVKVMQEQTGDLVRELQYKDFKAMGFSAQGRKGAYVDVSA